jgi:dephospho-CoA kinase
MPAEKRGVVVGVAGLMGAGKSTVARAFEDLGAIRLDADEIGKALLKDEAVRRRVVEAFGEEVLGADGEVDTSKLGEAAFRDGECARRLGDITRAPLIEEIKARAGRLKREAQVIVVDAALLPEWGARAWLDFLIVVDSDEEACVRRLVENGRFAESAVRSRLACQVPRAAKKRDADLVILNDGSEQDLVVKAREAYERVLERT